MDKAERKKLVERLRDGRWKGETTCGPAAEQIEADGKRIAELEAFQQQAIKQICELAREAGEAKGKLEGSEMPGIVDGWRDKCEAQAKRIDELEGLLREAKVKLIDVQGACATRQYGANLLTRICAALGDKAAS